MAISAAGACRSDDGRASFKPINWGLRSEFMPQPEAEVGHCVHHIAAHPSGPQTLFTQKHWDVMRSNNYGENWFEVSGNQPDTMYVIPIKSDGEHFPPEDKLRVYRSRSGGHEWEPLTEGLPQSDCYVNMLRNAMSMDRHSPRGVYFGTTGGEVLRASFGVEVTLEAVRQPLHSIDYSTCPTNRPTQIRSVRPGRSWRLLERGGQRGHQRLEYRRLEGSCEGKVLGFLEVLAGKVEREDQPCPL